MLARHVINGGRCFEAVDVVRGKVLIKTTLVVVT